MNAQILSQAIKDLAPNAQFAFSDVDLSTLEWHDKKIARPKDEEILAQCDVVIARMASETAAKAAIKEAVLTKLGLTAEEAASLLQ